MTTDTEVIIGGKVLTMSGHESEEYMQKVALILIISLMNITNLTISKDSQ